MLFTTVEIFAKISPSDGNLLCEHNFFDLELYLPTTQRDKNIFWHTAQRGKNFYLPSP